jgi:diguanylate cyclase (GGDEF)-like protein
MRLMPGKNDEPPRSLPPLPKMTPEEEAQRREEAARLLSKPSEDYAASREFVVELLKLHYTRRRVDTVNEILSMIERALPGARGLSFFFDRATLLLEGGISAQLNRESVNTLLRDLKLDPDCLELTVVEGSAAHRILEDAEVVAIEPKTILEGLTVVRPENVGIRGAIAVPLEVDGEAFGILCIFLPEPPSSAQRAKLELIAAHAAIAIRNERDLDEAQRLNGVDPITWVPNRRTVTDRLAQEIDRSKRYSHSVGVVLLSVENFLALSGQIGANEANQVLRRIAMSLSSGFRGPDFCGRWDDAQFILVLPETDATGTATVRDRMADRLISLQGDNMEDVWFKSVIACVPEDGWSVDELIEVLAQRLPAAPTTFRDQQPLSA